MGNITIKVVMGMAKNKYCIGTSTPMERNLKNWFTTDMNWNNKDKIKATNIVSFDLLNVFRTFNIRSKLAFSQSLNINLRISSGPQFFGDHTNNPNIANVPPRMTSEVIFI